jgi:hypothetical protein
MARPGFPAGFVITLVLTLLLYAITCATIADSRSSDAAGNALSAAFGAMFAVAMWIGVAVLLVLARLHGTRSAWDLMALLFIGTASSVSFFMAMGRVTGGDKSALLLVIALPALPMLHAAWARFALPPPGPPRRFSP